MKHTKRKDLTIDIRVNMMLQAILTQGMYGAMTNLARRYKVSRTFVYQLLWSAELLFHLYLLQPSTTEKNKELERIEIDKQILLLRLEGKCPIQSISNILKYKGYGNCSEGYISERLKYYGKKLSDTLQGEAAQFLFYLSDEIFAGSKPILITVDANSTAILRIEIAENRRSESWKNHWIEIEKNYFYTLGLVSDRGKGLREGFREFNPNKPYQPDIFHEFRELTRTILFKFEKAAYKAIGYEIKCYKLLESARSDEVIDRRIDAYLKASKDANDAIEIYDTHFYLLNYIMKNLEIFSEFGIPNNPKHVKQEIQTAFELMKSMSHPAICKLIDQILNRLDETIQYFNIAEEVYTKLYTKVGDIEALKAICMSWQFNNKIYKAKTAKEKDFYTEEAFFWLSYAEGLLGYDITDLEQYVFGELDTIIRSSSLVETVNSFIRPFLDASRGQITQETLNLIMFYHSHRKYTGGKRKGKAPIEILTNSNLEKHWVDLILK